MCFKKFFMINTAKRAYTFSERTKKLNSERTKKLNYDVSNLIFVSI